jgi:nitroreductase
MTNEITMTNAVIKCILSRRATKYYDPAVTLSDDQIRELVRIGTTAPTSFHLQNWRFCLLTQLSLVHHRRGMADGKYKL